LSRLRLRGLLTGLCGGRLGRGYPSALDADEKKARRKQGASNRDAATGGLASTDYVSRRVAVEQR
jgi:hypothetical protein